MRRDVDFWLRGESVQNFGDFLSAYLLRTLFLPAPATGRTLRLIGSCIEDKSVPPSNAVWARLRQKPVFRGCGLRTADGLSPDRRDAAMFLAVRGPLTRVALNLPAEVPIGDPALLLPALHPTGDVPPSGETLVVPHIFDRREDAQLRMLTGCGRVLRPALPNRLAAIPSFIDDIAAADFVLCGALHAAITAAAYRRPFAFWDSGQIDLPFKWQDFAASVGIPAEFVPDVATGRAMHARDIAPRLEIPPLWPMLVAAPLPVRPDRLIDIIQMDLARHGQAAFAHAVPQAGTVAMGVKKAKREQPFFFEKKHQKTFAQMDRVGFTVKGSE
jgi:hypothetical protein